MSFLSSPKPGDLGHIFTNCSTAGEEDRKMKEEEMKLIKDLSLTYLQTIKDDDDQMLNDFLSYICETYPDAVDYFIEIKNKEVK